MKTHVDENKNVPSEKKINPLWLTRQFNQSGGREIRNVLRTIHFASTEISRNVMDVAYFRGTTYIFHVKERFDNILQYYRMSQKLLISKFLYYPKNHFHVSNSNCVHIKFSGTFKKLCSGFTFYLLKVS